MMAGDPIIAEAQYGLLNPLNWPLFLFSPIPEWLVLLRAMFPLWWAGAGLYLYLRRSRLWRLRRSAALTGAIIWNLITWALGMPSSSSHALIGGLLGAGLAKAGLKAIIWKGVTPTLLAIVGSPVVGFALALLMVFRPQGIFGSREEMALDAR